jgi:hypothetical protein
MSARSALGAGGTAWRRLTSPAETAEEMFITVSTEAEHIEVSFTFNLQHKVSAALEAKLRKMSDEIRELTGQSRAAVTSSGAHTGYRSL